MKVTFHSIDNENNKISFTSEGYYENDTIVFEDKSIESTKIYLSINSSSIIFKRRGNITMDLVLINQTKTPGYYKNNMGLEFYFDAFTDKLEINKTKIIIEYIMFLDNEEISRHKIWILLN